MKLPKLFPVKLLMYYATAQCTPTFKMIPTSLHMKVHTHLYFEVIKYFT